MRSGVLVALALAATVTTAVAEDRPARVGKVGLRVIQVFPDTQQALVLDRATGKHVVVSEGDRVGSYDVVEIEDDQVIVRAGKRELVLTAEAVAPTAPTAPTVAPPPATGLLDPYATVAPARPSAGPLDPYSGASAIREVVAPAPQRAGAPVDPYGPAVKPTVAAPTIATPTTPPVATPTTPPVATPTPPTPAVEPIRTQPLTIKRAELSTALADFDRLAKELGFVKTPGGVRISTVTTGSYVWKLGLRPGDVVTAIDGAPLRTLDDAAAAYVRLGSAKQLAIAVDRAGASGTLRFALK